MVKVICRSLNIVQRSTKITRGHQMSTIITQGQSLLNGQ